MKTYLFALAAVMLSGCGKVALNLDGLNPADAPVVKVSNGAEFVAASQQGQKTLSSYQVDSSAGASFSQLVATTPKGYRVYSTVQGQLESESVQQATAASTSANR